MGEYDIIVVGAGHAGCEAALASARMGKKTCMFAITLESIAMMPCNPSIGGTGKGHLVREIDALGGEMGVNIDKAFIQSKMLNTRKGPAVHSLRCQADKNKYHIEMKKTLEKEENLDIKQAEIVSLVFDDLCDKDIGLDNNGFNNRVTGVITATGAHYKAKAVILATGTFLRGKILIGESAVFSGPNGMAPSMSLAEQLREMNFDMRRFKTGTPARILASSISYDKMREECGDKKIVPFSFLNEDVQRDQISCWLTYTNEKTHKVIRDNFHRSALFSGNIEGIGPRYCPSIEDKINRFSDKERHQTFVEPEGLDTEEMYIQGMSTSLPEDVQEEFYKTIPGLENAKIVRPAYAIEYDSINSLSLKLNLETRHTENLFCAGQLNGSSGYEEAAAQGLMAGINAALKIDELEPFILNRDEAYIGVLIDDLITKGTNEPYRIMTSRAEYRLVLRQDNADIRLTQKAYDIGLVSEKRFAKFKEKKALVEAEKVRLNETMIKPEDSKEFLESLGMPEMKRSASLAELLKRPEVTYDNMSKIDKIDIEKRLRGHAANFLEVEIKYEGYIKKQLAQIEKYKKLEEKKLSQDINYYDIDGLRIEAQEKLTKIKPRSIGQASRISGVSPADINVLLIYLERKRRQG
ncbi:MAG: tRNA uridine-5-carboxymethylaminomethyl(34) synthesis enzyme MnmG [Eubacteriales bacterium]|nr:tRNA uridine-5-carboxymethylaminomethyl(34) synthesis enzyme MnmG [Eubacteriales bacterium]MDY3332441.1 tRNA uridine-5-carboxymethylaminomethyl(34) synthesis enzyme MnmG [Gallibacter sp.]